MDPIHNSSFDRPYTLGAFLDIADRDNLAMSLQALLGPQFVLEDEQGQALLRGFLAHEALPGQPRVPIEHEFETIGALRANCAAETVAAAGAMLQILIQAAARDRMTSELHLHAMQESYRELSEKHAALEVSQNRYRELAAHLDQRVKEQVGVIENTQRQLYQAEKMASVGQLAAGMAHEINNPIGFIQSNLTTAKSYVKLLRGLTPLVKQNNTAEIAALWAKQDLDFVLEDFDTLVKESLSGAQRIARIVADLKTFSNVDALGERPEDLNEILRVVAHLTETQYGGHAQIVLDLADDCPKLHCDAGKLNQVFLSLIQNAAQAVPAGGEVRLRSRHEKGWLRIDVEDNGCGIPPDVLPRVFDPFFTTRDVGRGTGLGLTVSRDVVVAHGGRIEIDSQPGRGTRVSVSLPTNESA